MKFNSLIPALLLASVLTIQTVAAQHIETEAQHATKPVPDGNLKIESGSNEIALPSKTGIVPQAKTRFVPTEKIHADDAVSFPVDI